MFCVYFTCYKGNKLPPFYIGSTNVGKINKGYHGSVESKKYSNVWKEEIKNNPMLFTTKIISIHSNRQEAMDKERKLQKHLQVVKSPLYINMSVASLNGFFGRDVSGSNNPNFGKKASPETCQKISDKAKGRKLSQLQIQQRKQEKIKWWNNHPEEKLTRSNQMSGSNNPQFGKTGDAHPKHGIKLTNNGRNNISKALKGKTHSRNHIKQTSITYKVQKENGFVFVGYGLSEFSRALGLSPSGFVYTLTSGKFRNGYKIIENLGHPTEEILPLIHYL